MVSSFSGAQAATDAGSGPPVDLSRPDYFASRRARVDGFVARHFTWPGTFHLHGAALGWDVLRAPVNVLLAPVLVLTRLLAALFRRIGLRRAGDWLGRRRVLLRTSVARRVEALVVSDLLELRLGAGPPGQDPDDLTRTVLSAPQLRDMIRKRATVTEAQALGQRVTAAVAEYAGTRSAVAEMTTSLCALGLGALVFQALTPGMISMAPGVAEAVARTTAVAAFPLGETLGGLWYGAFGTGASSVLLAATFAALMMAGSVVAAFAGILADPVQTRLGIHQRRLHRLIDTLEADLVGRGDKSFVAREHYYARLLDLWDGAASVIRMFRP